MYLSKYICIYTHIICTYVYLYNICMYIHDIYGGRGDVCSATATARMSNSVRTQCLSTQTSGQKKKKKKKVYPYIYPVFEIKFYFVHLPGAKTPKLCTRPLTLNYFLYIYIYHLGTGEMARRISDKKYVSLF